MRSRKYFEYLKANSRLISEHSFEEIRAVSGSGFDAISKLHKQLLAKISGTFEDLEKPVSHGFDMSKLDALKEKGNKAFFEDMNKIKTGKSGKNQVTGFSEEDIFGISAPAKQTTAPQKTSDLLELDKEMLGLHVRSEPKQQKDNKNDFLDLDFTKQVPIGTTTVNATPNKPTPNSFGDFDLMGLSTNTTRPSDDLVSFAKTPQPQSQPSFDLSNSDLVLDVPKKTVESTQKQSADPFNFIVF